MNLLYWVVVLTPFVYLAYKYFTRKHTYFADRNIKHEKPLPIFGNTAPILFATEAFSDYLQRLCYKFKSSVFFGLFDFQRPIFVIQDPELIKQIGIKEFEHFSNHQEFGFSEVDALFVNSLFALKDQKWRDMRSTLSPAFTGSKMRMMFDLMREAAQGFAEFTNSKVNSDGLYEVQPKSFFSRMTVDVLTTCAFGFRVDSLNEPNNAVYLNIKKMFDMSGSDPRAILKFIFIMAAPKLAEKFGIGFTPSDTASFFKKMLIDMLNDRKRSGTFRPDVIQLLLQSVQGQLKHDEESSGEKLKEFAAVEESEIGKSQVKRTWSDLELAAQCFLFFIAGFETSSTALTFAAYELLMNVDVQDRLFEEIQDTKRKLDGKPITYEVLRDMEYLDAVINEVLRIHPPVVVMDRVCNKTTQINTVSGESFFIPEKSLVWFPVYALHHHYKYFPNPEKFDPERFLGANKEKILPSTFLPFGVGARACIGSRFALMQMKSILFHLLADFSIEYGEKTMIPLRYAKGFNIIPDKEFYVDLKKRTSTK